MVVKWEERNRDFFKEKNWGEKGSDNCALVVNIMFFFQRLDSGQNNSAISISPLVG